MANNIVLRVGVYNNFNFTEKENEAVKLKQEEGYLPFVNSNSFVKIKPDFPSIITINPYLTHFVEPRGAIRNIKACRLKVYLGAITKSVYTEMFKALSWCEANKIPVLITFMRFRSKESLSKYVSENEKKHYSFVKGYYRLLPDSKKDLIKFIKSNNAISDELIYFCDLAEEGCPSCGNCAKLTYNLSADVESLSLSCSGDNGSCIFDCPDCWAKNIGKIFKFKYDEVTKNSKQKGKKQLDK